MTTRRNEQGGLDVDWDDLPDDAKAVLLHFYDKRPLTQMQQQWIVIHASTLVAYGLLGGGAITEKGKALAEDALEAMRGGET